VEEMGLRQVREEEEVQDQVSFYIFTLLGD